MVEDLHKDRKWQVDKPQKKKLIIIWNEPETLRALPNNKFNRTCCPLFSLFINSLGVVSGTLHTDTRARDMNFYIFIIYYYSAAATASWKSLPAHIREENYWAPLRDMSQDTFFWISFYVV